jgi:hypothetical protein
VCCCSDATAFCHIIDACRLFTLPGIESDVAEKSEEQMKKKLDRLRTSKEFQPQPAIDTFEIQVLLTRALPQHALFQKYARGWTIIHNKVTCLWGCLAEPQTNSGDWSFHSGAKQSKMTRLTPQMVNRRSRFHIINFIAIPDLPRVFGTDFRNAAE